MDLALSKYRPSLQHRQVLGHHLNSSNHISLPSLKIWDIFVATFLYDNFMQLAAQCSWINIAFSELVHFAWPEFEQPVIQGAAKVI
jgi:hypothetical protein